MKIHRINQLSEATDPKKVYFRASSGRIVRSNYSPDPVKDPSSEYVFNDRRNYLGWPLKAVEYGSVIPEAAAARRRGGGGYWVSAKFPDKGYGVTVRPTGEPGVLEETPPHMYF